MKQNERILVYLVTGFLAVILVVAVFFGRDGKPPNQNVPDAGVRDLGQILDQKPLKEGNPSSGSAAKLGGDLGGSNGLPSTGSGDAGTQTGGPTAPLVASVPLPASARVAQVLGESRRDRTVRIVRAIGGDSLDSLVRRWCGKRDPFLEEAKSLNEELTILRVGQEVVVPWVDDEVVLAAYELRQPVLVADPGRPVPANNSQPWMNASANTAGNGVRGTTGPTFQVPGASPSSPSAQPNPAGTVEGPAAPKAGAETYIVQKNDSLWKIAAKRYGNRNAPRMIEEIKRQNDLSDDDIKVGQKLALPAGT